MEKRYYLAYGSNLNVRQMRSRCPGARSVGTAVLEDCRLLFKGGCGRAFLTIEPAEGFTVPVGVWEVGEEDERRLDRYEGFPGFYRKEELSVTIKGIKTGRERNRKAFVYVMREGRQFGLPTEGYYLTCVEGYKDFGFDGRTLVEALALSGEELFNEEF